MRRKVTSCELLEGAKDILKTEEKTQNPKISKTVSDQIPGIRKKSIPGYIL